ncbi:MAG TPA: Na+/H+ antiporter NhaC family protein [Bacillota bacterium]|jgi:Na+/H+ antiporter NhaC|nr:Na+/H+ antiporter NhaC family protein [Bacillota bacterium]
MEHYGIISIIPPILAICLAIKTKNVLFSLFVGLFFASTALSGWNPISGFAKLIPDFIYAQVAGDSNMQSLTNLLIIGAFVAIIGATGGAAAFAKTASKLVTSKKKAETSMWLGGLFVWFSDSANSLLVGPIFQPIGDKYKVSREKFAYILDATSSPICALVPIISWGVYIMGLIQVELDLFPETGLTSWEVFVGAVPFQFYSILTLIMVGFVCVTQFDFGPMLKAQRRALRGQVLREGAVPLRNTVEATLPDGVKTKSSSVIIPIFAVLAIMFMVFFLNGFPKESLSGTVIRQGISLGFIIGAIIAVVLSVRNKVFTFKEAENIALGGMKDMVYLMILMVFAWSLGSACKSLGTAYFIMDIAEGFLNPAFLPAILFIAGACMSLPTGSSWGPYAILMPIGIPIAVSMGAPLMVSVAAIISGGLFGDHCSPLSDTTLLASMGAASDHMDHFKTQFPYALLVAGISTVLYVIAGFTESVIILIPGIALLFGLIVMLHKISEKTAEEPSMN